jgi:hypothetical protein
MCVNVFPYTLLLLSPAVVGAILTLDNIIRIEHDQHPEQWKQDGRPRYRRSKGEQASSLAYHRVAFVWLFQTPSWVRESAHLLGLLRRLRWLVGAWNVGVLAAAGAQMMMSGMRPC